ncbi:hypothetical protein BDV30DRAFT_75407 [Aspergillus minisclerotigenes]|uniref:Uncharacterized protein n=1 Tax=Aspergillus minisclerotigenes TaxID=656917 RepID=A0A5N6JLX6_9EURO|nr:hypothetical protein BDV30DRAFT_75407 [Aspergillus minisclerotigenes]
MTRVGLLWRCFGYFSFWYPSYAELVKCWTGLDIGGLCGRGFSLSSSLVYSLRFFIIVLLGGWEREGGSMYPDIYEWDVDMWLRFYPGVVSGFGYTLVGWALRKLLYLVWVTMILWGILWGAALVPRWRGGFCVVYSVEWSGCFDFVVLVLFFGYGVL